MIHYGSPQFGIELDPIPAAMIGLSLNTAATSSERCRARGDPCHRQGQWEAAASIGMTPRGKRYAALLYLPQACSSRRASAVEQQLYQPR